MNAYQFASGFLGRCIVRRSADGTPIYHPDEETRVLKQARDELKALGFG